MDRLLFIGLILATIVLILIQAHTLLLIGSILVTIFLILAMGFRAIPVLITFGIAFFVTEFLVNAILDVIISSEYIAVDISVISANMNRIASILGVIVGFILARKVLNLIEGAVSWEYKGQQNRNRRADHARLEKWYHDNK